MPPLNFVLRHRGPTPARAQDAGQGPTASPSTPAPARRPWGASLAPRRKGQEDSKPMQAPQQPETTARPPAKPSAPPSAGPSARQPPPSPPSASTRAAPHPVRPEDAVYTAGTIALRLASKLRGSGAKGSCLVGSAILVEALRQRGIESPRLRQGFLVMDSRVAVWHVEVDDEQGGCCKLDVAWASQAADLPPDARPRQTELLTEPELPPEVIRLDGDTPAELAILRSNEEGWARIQARGLEEGYWAGAPAPVLWLREEMLRELREEDEQQAAAAEAS